MPVPLRVLIVEDSEDAAVLLVRECKHGGYAPVFERVQTAAGMAAALDRQVWDIVLSDHNMPKFDAPAALRLIRERELDLPFIIISGSIGEEVLAAAMTAGAHDYIPKDNLGRVVPTVKRVLRDAAERKERRQAELALRESEERYALAVLGSRDGLWDLNPVTGQAHYSSRFKSMLGYEDDAFGDTIESFTNLIDESHREMVLGAIRDHLERRVPYDVEFRLLTKQGDSRWFCSRGQALWDQAGSAIRMAGSISDVTERKLAEMTLKEKLDIIERQQEAIHFLSTPIIEVWDGVLMMPLLGAVDGERAAHIMEVLLSAVVRARCRYVIIDLTGVNTIDAVSCDHIVKLVEAVQLLGSRGIVVGIRPEVAQTMVSLGLDLSRIVTLTNLREALVLCMKGRLSGTRPR
jgi:anti-anti-sigma factor